MRAFRSIFLPRMLPVLLLSTLCIACQSKPAPTPIAGELDLRAWDVRDIVFLHGPWLFFPHRLARDRDGLLMKVAGRETFRIPGTWNGRAGKKGEPMSGFGFATFSLRLRLPKEATPPLAVRVNFMLTAYELEANGRIICRNGKVGRNKSESHPRYLPCTGVLPAPDAQGEIQLLLRVSNFHHRRGGPRGHIRLGPAQEMQAGETRGLVLDVSLAAGMALAGIYYLLLFGQRRQQKEYVIFALLCFDMALRTTTLQEMVLARLWPGLSWELFIRVIFFTAYILPLLFWGFFRAAFPEEFSRAAFRVYAALSGLLVISLLMPMEYASWGILLISPLILINALHACVILARVFLRGRSLAGIQLLGFLLLLAFMINDMLHDLQIMRTGYYTSVGMFLFMGCQAYTLTLRYGRAYAEIEKMYRDLQDHQQAELELLELNESKDRFLAIISHDLRGPFSGMRESLRYLSDHGPALHRKELLLTIEKINQAGQGIHHLLENLLEWARSRMGRIAFEPVPIKLRPFLEENLLLFRESLEAKEIKANLRVADDATVFADMRMLGTIARNLISNAVKFTPRGGSIVLESGPARSDDSIEIIFADTGPGMATTFVSSAGLGANVKEGTEGEPGGGLGLLISRDLLALHGGALEVESSPGRGTRVHLILPG